MESQTLESKHKYIRMHRLFLIGIIMTVFLASCEKDDSIPTDNPSMSNRINLKGQVQSCNNSNLIDGYLLIASKNGISSVYISNGNFDTTFEGNKPFDTLLVYAIDLASLKTSDTLIRVVNDDSVDIGVIDACAWDVDEYINFRVNNEKFVFVPAFYDSLSISAWDTLNAPTTYFYREDIGNLLYKSKYHRTQFNGMSVGTFGMNWNSSIRIGRYYSFNLPSSGSITYNSYGAVNDYITGAVNVPFLDNTDSLNYVLTGTFKVRRDR